MERLAPISNKLKLEFKPCLKPLFASQRFHSPLPQQYLLILMLVSLSNTSAFPTSTSSTVTSASLSSFNCSSGNTASNAECTFFLKNVSTKVM